MDPVLWALAPLVVLVATIVFVLVRSRRRRATRGAVRDASAHVILEGNRWEACVVDDLHEPWTRLTTEPVRGFCGVSPGRHRVQTKTAAGALVTLDFVAYPGELLAWRLDADRARWEPFDVDGDTRAALARLPTSSSDVSSASSSPKHPGWLVHLRTTAQVAASRSSAPPAKAPDEIVDRVRRRLAKLVARAQSATEGLDAEAELLGAARALGESLIGRPLRRTELRAVVAPARDAARKLAAHGNVEAAMRVLGLGLALLPGDPELMVVAGCALAQRGDVDEALRALGAALERDRCLDAEDVARAMRTRRDLRERRGLGVHVS